MAQLSWTDYLKIEGSLSKLVKDLAYWSKKDKLARENAMLLVF
jgi:hypothetical protein